jgi:ParB family transcriptional regulator, chromosome partitioning protein
MTSARSGPQRRGLGKGLGALIPSQDPPDSPEAALQGASVATPGTGAYSEGATARYAEIPVTEVVPNPRQPRAVFEEEALTELMHSISAIGLLQPIVVRRSGAGYELIAGERRLRACRAIGLERIPAIIRQTEDDDMLRDALLENLHRANLNPLEEAAAYQQLLEDFGCTQEQLAERIGRSRPQVTNTLRLLRLPPDVQRRVAAGVLSAGHARALLSLPNSAAMESMAQRIVREGMSVRAVEESILLGDGAGQAEQSQRKRKPRAGGTAQAAAEIAQRLADVLDTRVTVAGMASTKSRGRVIIEVADLEDLRRIIAILDR